MRKLLICSALVLMIAGQAQAQRSGQAGVQTPPRGVTMERVEQLIGQPAEKVPSVGEPPISRWRYGDFTVYFEYNLVLHTVVYEN